MKKKRAQNKKNISPKKTRRKTRKNNRTQPKNNIKRNKALKDQEEIEEIQTLQKENLLTSIKIDTNQPVVKENIVNYYSKPIVNAFETYSSGLLEIFLKEESKKENLNRINEEILSNFGLTKELRKFAFKYLAEILQQYQIHKKSFNRSQMNIMEFNQGNISTIVSMLWIIFCPYISQYVTQEAFIAICGLIIIVWSACNPNSFEIFGNAVDKTIQSEETVLNDEYEVDSDDTA
jgi:hypothetical protein